MAIFVGDCLNSMMWDDPVQCGWHLLWKLVLGCVINLVNQPEYELASNVWRNIRGMMELFLALIFLSYFSSGLD